MKMARETHSVRLDEDVDEWLDEKSEEWGASRSDIVNRAVVVYGAKMKKGEWVDPRFRDKHDQAIEDDL